MKKVLKWVGITIAALVVVLALSSWIITSNFNKKLGRVVEMEVAPVAILTDSASIERGRLLAVGCRHCHGVDMAGSIFFDDKSLGSITSSNLTKGKNGPTEGYTNEDFIKALRHGLNKNGSPLLVMPSEATTHFSDIDLGSLIGFLNTLTPKENPLPKTNLSYMGQILAGAGAFGPLFSYDIIDHAAAKNIVSPPMSKDPEYGQYIVKFSGCVACHQADFGGGKSPNPSSPPVPDITKSGNLKNWSLSQFIEVFKTGKTPEGKVLSSEFMPFDDIGVMSDVEIESVYNYLNSLPAAN